MKGFLKSAGSVVSFENYPPFPPLFLSVPLLLLSLLPHSLLPPAMPLSSSHTEREHGCFDVGFDRFVCCCIHLLCIRELTGRKMKICLRFSAWLFGGKCERTPRAFQIHIFLYLKSVREFSAWKLIIRLVSVLETGNDSWNHVVVRRNSPSFTLFCCSC